MKKEECTNIVTVRSYEDGSSGLSINGREIPHAISIQSDIRRVGYDDLADIVTIRLHAAQVNWLEGDREPDPARVPKFVLVPGKPSWWDRIKAWWKDLENFDA